MGQQALGGAAGTGWSSRHWVEQQALGGAAIISVVISQKVIARPPGLSTSRGKKQKINAQRSAKRIVRGWVKFLPALAKLLCLALSGSCLAIFAYFFADLCTCALTLLIYLQVQESFNEKRMLRGLTLKCS